MNRKEIINMTEEFVREKLEGFDSGHDWWHIMRVRKMALYINKQEKMADSFTLEIAALLHDTADRKFTDGDPGSIYKLIGDFLTEAGMADIRGQVMEVISNVSYSNKDPYGNLSDPVLLILQDADRLDAIGAIGIARAFNYGGFRNRAIYSPSDQNPENEPTTISHFYDKLLRLKELMNTQTGRLIALERHEFLLKFLDQFYKEWEFAG